MCNSLLLQETLKVKKEKKKKKENELQQQQSFHFKVNSFFKPLYRSFFHPRWDKDYMI